MTKTDHTEDSLGFPPRYLAPISTPQGLAYPNPVVRLLIEDIENIQKRMVAVRMKGHPVRLSKNFPGKAAKDREKADLLKQSVALERELVLCCSQLGKAEVTAEQFIQPMQETDGKSRVESEQWSRQYKDAIALRAIEIHTVVKPDEGDDTPEVGTFLQR